MKKALTILLLLLALILSACGSGGEKPASSASPTETSQALTPAPSAETEEQRTMLSISEAMAANKATLADRDGNFPDWVELYNASADALVLDGFSLHCGEDRMELSGNAAGESYTLVMLEDFGISASGETVELRAPDGSLLDSLRLPASGDDQSFTHEGLSDWPSPGFENSREGYLAFQETRTADELAIGEAAVYDPAGDWVELVNCSEQTLELSDYCLSDKGKERLLYPIPSGELEPGARRLLRCEELGLGLDAQRDTLYLSRSDGTLLDYVNLHDIPLGGSMGRIEGEGGFFWFEKSSPNAANSDGFRDIAAAPSTLDRDGVFEGVESVSVTLTAEDEIRYTLDGSTPTTSSTLYTGPITIEKTSVLRAAAFREGSLPSEALNLSYILNEGHSLPVVSLICDPELLFGRVGIYTHPTEKWEVPGAVMYYDGGEGFSLACGVKIHGATSRVVTEKKSFKLCFRSRYEGKLQYDLFSNGVTTFSSILLRSDVEARETSYIRDNVMHQLARDAFPSLPRQDYRPAVLYINGIYWGLYNIREAHSAEHFAQHTGADPEAIIQWQGKWDPKSFVNDVYSYACSHDLRDPEAYAYVSSHLDMDSVIAWSIMEVYSGNFDFNSPNMRFYWNEDTQKLSYALVDLDLGMFDYGDFRTFFGFGYAYTDLAHRLSQNPEFRERLCMALGDALRGPLSEDALQNKIDELAEQYRPEVARDLARWGGRVSNWERMIERLHDWAGLQGGFARYMIRDLKEYYHLSAEEREQYFAGLYD